MPRGGEKGLNTEQAKVAAELRRYQMLELYKAGTSERQIAEALHLDRTTVHRGIKRILNTLADQHSENADRVRALQMERYTTLLATWWR